MQHKCLSPWKGAVIGGLIAFAWNALAWTLLPLHGTAAIHPLPPSPPTVVLGLFAQGFGAFFWTWILGKIPGLTSQDAALYGAFFGLCLGALGAVPVSIWWGFPWRVTLATAADAVIAWTIASVAIARWGQAAACALPAPPAAR